jgi:hypothetical protein
MSGGLFGMNSESRSHSIVPGQGLNGSGNGIPGDDLDAEFAPAFSSKQSASILNNFPLNY